MSVDAQADANPFDFEKHERDAVVAYLEKQAYFQSLASVVARIVEECMKNNEISVHSVQFRAKDPASFGKKAAIPSENDANKPKYEQPMSQITDLSGVRVITQLHGTLNRVDWLIAKEFDVVERSDKSKGLIAEDKFGYQSIHYLVRLKKERSALAEYHRFADSIVEIQVRTILQHAWAEIEHDIQYKSSYTIPAEIRRRFMALAGLLELADREFQAIQSADKQLANKAATMVRQGDLKNVEITPNALKIFLDGHLGVDGRMSDWSYEWSAKQLRHLGFKNLKQVESAIAQYDGDRLSQVATGGRQGQITRFEMMLLAALGSQYLEGHSWKNEQWFSDRQRGILTVFEENGINVGTVSINSLPE